MPTRRRGSGSVYRSRDPRRRAKWCAVVVVGWKPDGRPIRVARYASTRREAEALRSRMAASLRGFGRLPDERTTVSEMLVAWYNGRAPDLAPTSQRTYAHAIRHVAERMGTMRAAAVTPSTIEAVLLDIPPATARMCRAVLSAAYRDALRDGTVDRNPVELARSRPHRPREQRVPTTDDIQRLVAHCRAAATPMDCALVVTLVTTGLRRGELLGLRWTDIDGATLTVRRQVVAGLEREVKTPESRRTIALPPLTVDALRRWRIAQSSVQISSTRRVFPVSEHSVARILARCCAAAGIEPFPPHSARRFVATILAADPKAAAMTLGHASAKLSLDVYARGTAEQRTRAAAAVGAAILPTIEPDSVPSEHG